MEKQKMHTSDLTGQNIEQIAKIFPNVITESRDEEGHVKKAVDFDQLRQMLSNELVENDDDERYRLDWPGKKASLLKANTPITKTLRPVKAESKDFENTENLYLEGDNFEILKILQESYLGKVKMIYIDPPYNTGQDFVYTDKFQQTREDYEEELGVEDEEGGKLFRNTDSNGRFHSDWLSMMYERLLIARDLLKEDGVIFMSIDDNEVANLRKIGDEIFGEENFVAQIIWKKRSTPPNDKVIGHQHEYIVTYSKNIELVSLNLRERTKEQLSRYKNPDNHPKGPWTPGDLMANIKGGRYVKSLYYPIVNPKTGEKHYPSSDGNWRYSKETIEKLISNNEIYFGNDGKGRPKLKRFISEIKSGITWTSLWDFVPLNTAGSQEMSDLLGNLAVFDNPKPIGLLKELVKLGSNNDSIILDFFSGSSSCAHSIMQFNAENSENRKFIMAQLPEKTDIESQAHKAGFTNVCELGKERIRRAGKKIKEELLEKYQSELDKLSKDQQLAVDDTQQQQKKELEDKIAHIQNLDTGFRVYKTDTTNMKDVYYHPTEIKQEQLEIYQSNIKEDRTPEDLLTQVLLDLGLTLDLPMEEKKMKGNKVFVVQTNALVACFDDDINFDIVDEIAKIEPLKVVFKDASFKDDKDRINVSERFKRLSPETQVTVI